LGTASTGFEAYFKGRVLGQVFDAGGVPYSQGFFHLENSTTSIYGHSKGKDGRFEVEGVPPGEYKLYIEIHDSKDKERKYYYPGTYDAAKAGTIKMTLGEVKRGLRFTLPKEFRVRTITGQVSWADGTPASNVEVLLLCPQSPRTNGFTVESSPPGTETDKAGRFTIGAIAGTVYWLEARARQNEEEFFHSPLNKITVIGNIRNKKLVLSETGFSGGCGTSQN
jgi:hypothetical protein